MKNKKLEYRQFDISNYNPESGIVEGYAAVFNTPSVDLGFTEVIERNALTNDTIQQSDVFAVIDHNRERGILARSRNGQGSLKLSLDDKGLKYSFTLPSTEIGNELRSHLERQEITASSFAFTVLNESWEHTDNKYIRHINAIDRIYDVSPVFNAAYENTEVALRSFEAFKEEEQAKEQAKAEKAIKEQVELRKKITKMKHKLFLT